MELFHGKTYAFKDFALSFLPRIMSEAIRANNLNEVMVLTATSGDTGSAALNGFKNVDKTKVIVFYPTIGISEVQKRQMTTIDGNNTHAYGIKGNFDDAQKALKEIFNDESLKKYLENKGYSLSSANSINIARLVPQIVYYFYAYYEMVKSNSIEEGESISISVPTGNFGNILAGYLAKNMGLPIKDLICASNKNNILTDFINTGIYDTNREFFITNSPSMDILVSSNLERFLYYSLNKDSELIKNLMKDLKETGKFKINKEKLKNIFAYSYNDEQTLNIIKEVYEDYGYLLDTHSAIGIGAAKEYQKHNNIKVLVAATASYYKFPKSVTDALGLKSSGDIESLAILSENSKQDVQEFKNLLFRDVTQNKVIDKTEIKSVIKEIVN